MKEITIVADRLKAEGKSKAVEGAKSYRPAFFPGLPPAAQEEFQSLVKQALG